MFSIKHMMSLGLMLLMLSTMVVFTTGVASAHTTSPTLAAVSCLDTSCDGKSPISTSCAGDGQDMHVVTSSDLGGGLRADVTLRYSATCGAAWAKVTFKAPMPSGHYGDAGIKSSRGMYYDCSSAGGNGWVSPGQTSCYTPMVGDYHSSESAYAAGFYSTNGIWKQVATTASY
jgi:hypothetical protein